MAGGGGWGEEEDVQESDFSFLFIHICTIFNYKFWGGGNFSMSVGPMAMHVYQICPTDTTALARDRPTKPVLEEGERFRAGNFSISISYSLVRLHSFTSVRDCRVCSLL